MEAPVAVAAPRGTERIPDLLPACRLGVGLEAGHPAGLRIVEADVAARVDREGAEGPPVVAPAEEIVPAAHLVTPREVEREHEVRDIDAVDRVVLVLHGVA